MEVDLPYVGVKIGADSRQSVLDLGSRSILGVTALARIVTRRGERAPPVSPVGRLRDDSEGNRFQIAAFQITKMEKLGVPL
jgi:hypothetical protein